MTSLPIRLCLLVAISLLFVPLAVCDPILFSFSANVNATPFGLSSSTPAVFSYVYDPAQAPFPGSNASYPIDFSLTVGGYLTHEHGALDIVIQPSYKQYELSAAGYVTYFPGYNGMLTGSVNGIPLWIVQLNIL